MNPTIYHKFLHFINTLDGSITRNLADAGIIVRPTTTKSNGLWCFAIMPTILIINSGLYKVSSTYGLAASISVGFISYSLLFIFFISLSCVVLKDSIYGGCVASGLLACLFVCMTLKLDMFFSMLLTVPSIFLYSLLVQKLITKMPKTFTVGEAMIVSQSLVLFTVCTVAHIRFVHNTKGLGLVNTVVITVLSTVALLVTALNTLSERRRTLFGLAAVVAGCAIVFLIALHAALGFKAIMNVISFVFINDKRTKLFFFWLCMLVIAVVIILNRTKMVSKANTVTRKYFHILAALVFMSGILTDVELMRLAAGITFGVIIVVEALRKSNIEPISPALESAFQVYSDEKDCGSIALTPIYLFTGLACPLLLVPDDSCTLMLLSGVLSVGVGDTAASWFGSRYGVIKWLNSNRTVEGTMFNILSQMVLVYLLALFGLLHESHVLLRTAISATLTSLVEAKTEQIDNLILPLVSIIGFQISNF